MLMDYSHLPSDVLRIVFANLFSCKPGQEPMDIRTAYRQWVNVRLACRHWDEVLCGTPPPVDLRLTPAPADVLLRWLPTAPVRSLTLESSSPDNEPKDAEAGAGSEECTAGLMSTRQLLLGMEGIGTQPFWSPAAALQHVQVLSLQHWRLTEDAPLAFDASPLQALPRLETLSLGALTAFQLDGLPGSLRRLELVYDARQQFSMPELPQHLRLDWLRVAKAEGVLGLDLDDVWDSCKEVVLDAQQLMLGIPCEESLVRQFERPYREGVYVPPHILGDMDELERSQNAAAHSVFQLFAGASRSAALKALRLAGGCGAAVTLVPMHAGDKDALPFIFRSQPAMVGMVRDIRYLFSLDAHELAERAAAWLQEQQLLAEDGEAPMPGVGATGAIGVQVRMRAVGSVQAAGAQAPPSGLEDAYPEATLRVWREGDAGTPPPFLPEWDSEEED